MLDRLAARPHAAMSAPTTCSSRTRPQRNERRRDADVTTLATARKTERADETLTSLPHRAAPDDDSAPGERRLAAAAPGAGLLRRLRVDPQSASVGARNDRPPARRDRAARGLPRGWQTDEVATNIFLLCLRAAQLHRRPPARAEPAAAVAIGVMRLGRGARWGAETIVRHPAAAAAGALRDWRDDWVDGLGDFLSVMAGARRQPATRSPPRREGRGAPARAAPRRRLQAAASASRRPSAGST